MRRALIAASLIALCGIAGAVAIRADDSGKERDLRAELIGTWRMVSLSSNGKDAALDKTVNYRHVTPGAFVWVSCNKTTGVILHAAGGGWRLDGNTFTEKAEYGTSNDFKLNGEHRIRVKIDGDHCYESGRADDESTIDVVWERVRPAQATAK